MHQTWTFRHPDFHAHRKDALENIKRKVPAARKASSPTSSSTTTRPLSPTHYSPHQSHHHPYQSSCVQSQVHVESLQNEVRRLQEEGEDMRTRIRTLERNYESVLLELVTFQRGMAQQDGIMQNLITYFVNSESGEYCSSSSTPSATGNASARFTGRLLTATSSVGNGENGFGVAGMNGGGSGFNTFSALGIVGRGVFSHHS